MKHIIRILFIAALFMNSNESSAQRTPEGFNYSAHNRMNNKASRWGKRRVKASGNDQLNMKCSVRKSRQYSRKKH